jgi:dienelactone hydrolase
LVALVCAASVARGQIAPDSPPTTRPGAAVQTFVATDLPLDLNGATGDLARRLSAFDLKPQRFQYTLQLIDEGVDDNVRAWRLAFPSPFKSPFPENNVVPCEYYEPKHIEGQIRSAIVLDIMAGNAVVPRGIARGLASQGIAALYVPMAYYNSRRPKDRAHVRWLEDQPDRMIDPPKQTVLDIRRAKAILASRGEIDPRQISITGVSLGGIMASMAAGIDGHFARVVPILAGGDLAAMTFHAPETRRARQRLLDEGIDQQKLGELMAPVEPLNFASRIDPKHCLMINARNDEVIPRECTMALWLAIGKPQLLWVPSGHYSAAWFMPTIKQTAIDFLKGKPVKELEF